MGFNHRRDTQLNCVWLDMKQKWHIQPGEMGSVSSGANSMLRAIDQHNVMGERFFNGSLGTLKMEKTQMPMF